MSFVVVYMFLCVLVEVDAGFQFLFFCIYVLEEAYVGLFNW